MKKIPQNYLKHILVEIMELSTVGIGKKKD